VRKRLADARTLTRWAAAADQVLDTEELMLLSLLIDQSPRVLGRCLARLAVTGAPARRLAEAAGAARRLLGRLDRDRLSPSAVDELLRPCSPATVAAAWLLGGTASRRRIKWFLARGRLVRPVLSGDDLVRLGVPHGPSVGRALAELRRRRLDGIVSSRHEEEAFVNQWRLVEKGDSR
jgi:tRNA nucleotidyltransferase (CCA-adding enzyme)